MGSDYLSDEKLDHLKFRGTGGEIVLLFAFGSLGVANSFVLFVLMWVYTDNYNTHIIELSISIHQHLSDGKVWSLRQNKKREV